MALFKVRGFLEEGLRLRTACDLECMPIEVKRPSGFQLPSWDELKATLPGLIENASAAAGFEVATVTYISTGKPKKSDKTPDSNAADASDNSSEG